MLQTVTNKYLKSNDLWFINWEIEKKYHEIIDNNRKNRIVFIYKQFKIFVNTFIN